MKKTVLVTGAGSGIGRAAAIRLSKEGYDIVLVGRRQGSLDETLAMLDGQSHKTVAVDVGDKTAIANAFSSVLSTDDNLIAVFANAGIGGENRYGDEDRWEDIIQTNLTGPYYTIMESLPYLEASKADYKHVLITGSCLSRFAVPNHAAYISSKTGVNGLTKALAIDLAPKKILVNAILPGWVDTEMAQSSIQKGADRTKRTYKEAHSEQMSYVPLQKMSQPDEIADLVQYLLSGSQTSMTGQSIDINNGSFMI